MNSFIHKMKDWKGVGRQERLSLCAGHHINQLGHREGNRKQSEKGVNKVSNAPVAFLFCTTMETGDNTTGAGLHGVDSEV